MKRAIVLAGGGTKGSYEVGVWRALNELGIDYQIVTRDFDRIDQRRVHGFRRIRTGVYPLGYDPPWKI